MQGVLILAVLMSAVAADPVETEVKETGVSDAAITARVNGLFVINKHLSALNINVNTHEGVVQLVGSVDDETQKEMAGDLASSTRGVKKVKNELIVVGTSYSEKEKRSFKQKLMDKKISTAVRTRLVANRELKGLKIGVETVNQVVTLHGVVGTEIQKARIAQIAGRGEDVKSVVNNLTVRPRDASGFFEGIGQQFSDEWVESRVSTAILMNRHLSIGALDVEVDDGVCIVTGVVNTEAQRKLAGSVAESIHGVNEVRNEVRVREEELLDKKKPELVFEDLGMDFAE